MNFYSIKRILTLLAHYFLWQRIFIWFVVAGLIILAVGFSLPAPGANAVETPFPLIGVMLVFLGPCMSAPFVFRNLISNRRLAYLPNIHLFAGYALLALALLSSLSIYLYTQLSDLKDISFLFSLQLFIVYSAYCALVQSYCTRPETFVYLVFIYWAGRLLDNQISFLYNSQQGLTILALIAAGGWIYGLELLRKKPFFAPSTAALQLLGMQFQAKGKAVKKGNTPTNYFPEGDLSGETLLGSGDISSLKQTAFSYFLITVAAPLLATLLLMFAAWYRNDWNKLHSMDFFILVFLLASMLLTIISNVAHYQLFIRCRLLWLRLGGNRTMLWQHLEKIILTRLSITCLLIITTAFLVNFSSLISVTMAMHFALLTLASCFFWTYFISLSRIKAWSSFANIAIIVLIISMVVILGMLMLSNSILQNSDLLYFTEAALLISALLSRYFAQKSFQHINWFVMRPKG